MPDDMIKRFCNRGIEQVRAMTATLAAGLELRQGARAAEFLRTAQTLRGTCHLLGFAEPAEILGQIEDISGLLFRWQDPPIDESVNTLTHGLEAVLSFLESVRAGEQPKSLDRTRTSLETIHYLQLADVRGAIERLSQEDPDVFEPLTEEQLEMLVRHCAAFSHLVAIELAFSHDHFSDDIALAHGALNERGLLISAVGTQDPSPAGYDLIVRYLSLTNRNPDSLAETFPRALIRIREFFPFVATAAPDSARSSVDDGTAPSDLSAMNFVELQEMYRRRFGRIDWLSRKELIDRIASADTGHTEQDALRTDNPREGIQMEAHTAPAETSQTEAPGTERAPAAVPPDETVPGHPVPATAVPGQNTSAEKAPREARNGAAFDYEQEFAKLQELFLEEASQNIGDLRMHLRTLSQAPDEETVTTIHRVLHNLKGSGGSYNYNNLSRVAHMMETFLQPYRQEVSRIDADVISRLRRGIDNLEHIVQWSKQGDHELIPIVEIERDLHNIFKPRPVLPGPAAPSAEIAAVETARDEDSMRVDLKKIDAIVNAAVELSIAQHAESHLLSHFSELLTRHQGLIRTWDELRIRIEEHLREQGFTSRDMLLAFGKQLARLHQQLGEFNRGAEANMSIRTTLSKVLSTEVLQLQVLPLGTLFHFSERFVRDIAAQTGKNVRLTADGAEIEVDRRVLETLKEPVLHLLRNAIEHGIELPGTRRTVKKPDPAVIRLSVRQVGYSFVLSIADDGMGIDRAWIIRTAAERGLAAEAALQSLSHAEVFRLLFQPGFRAGATDETDGGGLHTIAAALAQIGGEINMTSQPGHGTTVEIVLPANLRHARMFVIEVGGMAYAFPVGHCERIIMLSRETVRTVGGRSVTAFLDGMIATVTIEDLLGVPFVDQSLRNGIILRSEEEHLCLSVPAIVDELELMTKPLPDHLRTTDLVSGAAILPSGKIALILNHARLFERQRRVSHAAPVAAEQPLKREILVVDDSFLARELFKTILLGAGYKVSLAGDGEEALSILRARAVDLLLTDLEMPNMHGLDLVSAVRADPALQGIPVIVITAYEDEQHQRECREAGVDETLVKGVFDRDNLLETVRKLLGVGTR